MKGNGNNFLPGGIDRHVDLQIQYPKCGTIFPVPSPLSEVERIIFGGKTEFCPGCKAIIHIPYKQGSFVPELYKKVFSI